MSKFEPEQFINYERIEQNVEVVKQRLGILLKVQNVALHSRYVCVT